jgi:hypothetical protein
MNECASGLVISSYLARFGSKYINAIFTIGTPFSGGGALTVQTFLQGYAFGNFALSPTAVRDGILNSPSVYEILPDPSFSWSEIQPPSIYYTVCEDNDSESILPVFDTCTSTSRKVVGPRQFGDLIGNVLKDHEVLYWLSDSESVKRPTSFNHHIWEHTQQARQQWRKLDEVTRSHDHWTSDLFC